ncbi:2-(3-amino-3-carboxypropyl)histidine synthase subunit 2 [Chironomus tepperi]|uniref:2-(3-amino-3-carboxypropyl)histidine synthase subunit 2 n=1 Tax=Chironomus tepperi TaxID=113505 RepID=UPI00391F4F11
MSVNFSSSDKEVIEKQVDIQIDTTVKLSDIWTGNDLNRCIKFIREKFLTKICLQFSDDILHLAVQIESELAKHVDSHIFILADTSYGSCCIDEIAASHMQADGLIHFGHACLSKVTRLPVLYIFPKNQVDVDKFIECFNSKVPDKMEKVFIFYDVGSYHVIDCIANKLNQLNYINIDIGKLAESEEADVLCWSLKNNQSTENYTCIYIGKDNQSFFNISMGIKCKKWLLFDITTNTLQEMQAMDTKFLMKRSHYIEKCKDAQTLGIVVGTLTMKGYLDIIKHIQDLTRRRHIKTYIFSVGKINSAKLANFSEIDCFVLVGCSENNLYNSRDFYKPLISVFEAEMALNPAWSNQFPDTYSTDFREMLPEGKLYRSSNEASVVNSDVSLITGKLRYLNDENDEEANKVNNDGTLMETGNNQLSEIDSLNKFQERTFQGLDMRLGQDGAAKVEVGRSGVPMSYNELDF